MRGYDRMIKRFLNRHSLHGASFELTADEAFFSHLPCECCERERPGVRYRLIGRFADGTKSPVIAVCYYCQLFLQDSTKLRALCHLTVSIYATTEDDLYGLVIIHRDKPASRQWRQITGSTPAELAENLTAVIAEHLSTED